jgi:hypothetical protein
MKIRISSVAIFLCLLLLSCTGNPESGAHNKGGLPIEGTWKLIKGTVIENGKTTVTDYTVNQSFIKIINADHFAFMQHDLSKGKDTAASFSSGGGAYTLTGDIYTEHLEFCSAREWEGNDFKFNVTIKNDTLIQSGIEEVKDAGVNRLNTETYVRLKK